MRSQRIPHSILFNPQLRISPLFPCVRFAEVISSSLYPCWHYWKDWPVCVPMTDSSFFLLSVSGRRLFPCRHLLPPGWCLPFVLHTARTLGFWIVVGAGVVLSQRSSLCWHQIFCTPDCPSFILSLPPVRSSSKLQRLRQSSFEAFNIYGTLSDVHFCPASNTQGVRFNFQP